MSGSFVWMWTVPIREAVDTQKKSLKKNNPWPKIWPLWVYTYPCVCRHDQLCWGQQACFLSACSKNTPDESRGGEFGSTVKKKNLIRTNVICRSMCGCVWQRKSIPSQSSSGHSWRIDRLVSLFLCDTQPCSCLFGRLHSETRPRLCHPRCL